MNEMNKIQQLHEAAKKSFDQLLKDKIKYPVHKQGDRFTKYRYIQVGTAYKDKKHPAHAQAVQYMEQHKEKRKPESSLLDAVYHAKKGNGHSHVTQHLLKSIKKGGLDLFGAVERVRELPAKTQMAVYNDLGLVSEFGLKNAKQGADLIVKYHFAKGNQADIQKWLKPKRIPRVNPKFAEEWDVLTQKFAPHEEENGWGWVGAALTGYAYDADPTRVTEARARELLADEWGSGSLWGERSYMSLSQRHRLEDEIEPKDVPKQYVKKFLKAHSQIVKSLKTKPYLSDEEIKQKRDQSIQQAQGFYDKTSDDRALIKRFEATVKRKKGVAVKEGYSELKDALKAIPDSYEDAWDSDTMAVWVREPRTYRAIVPAEIPGKFQVEYADVEKLTSPMTLAQAIDLVRRDQMKESNTGENSNAIAKAFKDRDEEGLKAALENASVEEVKSAMDIVGYSYKGSKAKTAKFLVDAVRESRKQRIRH